MAKDTGEGGEGLSLGGGETSAGNVVYNPLTGQYERDTGDNNYKQVFDLGTGQNNWILRDGADWFDMKDNADQYTQTPTNTAGVPGVVWGGGEAPYESPLSLGDVIFPEGTGPGGGGGGTPPPTGGGGGLLPTLPPNTRPDLPQPPGGPVVPGGQPPVDTSWDWDAFAPKRQGDAAWGGYDQDYQAFERYQPGQDSPWGMPDIEGGNKEFYQQQFANLLRDDQGYRNRAREAQGRAQEAMNNPIDANPTDWSWANGGKGLGETVTSTGTPEDNRQWGLTEGFSQGMTQSDILAQAATWDGWSEKERDQFNAFTNPDSHEGGLDADFFNKDSWWTNVAGDPQRIQESLRASDYSGANKEWLGSIADRMYQKQGALGPSAPAGYAQPLAYYAPTAGEG